MEGKLRIFRPYGFLGVCALASALCGAFGAAAAPAEDVPFARGNPPAFLERQPAGWSLQAGLDALQAGLPALAEKFLSAALEGGGLSAEQTERAGLALSAAQLSLYRTAEAREALERWVSAKNPVVQLRYALIAYREGDAARAKGLLQKCAADKLPAEEQPWWWMLTGLVAESQGDAEKAQSAFERALLKAGEGAGRALFETAISRGRILSGKATPEMAEELRKKVEESKNTPMETQFAKELAVVLLRLGKIDEALALLSAQIDRLDPQGADEKNQLRLMYALMRGAEAPDARAMAREVLRGRGARDVQQSALYLLAGAELWRENPSGLLEILKETLAETPDHPLRDEMLPLVARLSFETGDLDGAQAAAAALVSEFPAAAGKAAALRLLAQTALAREPPQYRVAADTLGRLRAELPAGAARARCTLLLADAYFLNSDYAEAAALYAELMRLEKPPLPRGDLLFRETLAALRAGRVDEAARRLDAAVKKGGADAENTWRAEWSLLRALQASGRSDVAFARLRARLHGENAAKISPDLRLRLLWMEAQLALEAGRDDEAPKLAESLVFMTDTLPDGAASADLRRRLSAAALLLAERAFLNAGKKKEGFAAFERLEREYPDDEAAALGGFVAARALAVEGRLADAQRLVMRVAEKYPKGKYAAAALYEAAALAEEQASAGAYAQAAALLDDLVKRYPESEYVFFARLRQGDIARKLNDFGAALAVYDAVLAAYPDHPERPRAEMARADALLALAAKDSGKHGAAEAAYERLFAMSDLPDDTRAEAGFKWGFALERAGNASDARAAYWLALSRYLRDGGKPEGEGRYWLSRCALRLGDLLAASGDARGARAVYALISEHGLPGAGVAAARIEMPPVSERPSAEPEKGAAAPAKNLP